jgi:hypothetical protein
MTPFDHAHIATAIDTPAGSHKVGTPRCGVPMARAAGTHISSVISSLWARDTHGMKYSWRSSSVSAKARRDWDESPSRFSSLFAHDLFGKPLHTFPDHALDPDDPGSPATRRSAANSLKTALDAAPIHSGVAATFGSDRLKKLRLELLAFSKAIKGSKRVERASGRRPHRTAPRS